MSHFGEIGKYRKSVGPLQRGLNAGGKAKKKGGTALDIVPLYETPEKPNGILFPIIGRNRAEWRNGQGRIRWGKRGGTEEKLGEGEKFPRRTK